MELCLTWKQAGTFLFHPGLLQYLCLTISPSTSNQSKTHHNPYSNLRTKLKKTLFLFQKDLINLKNQNKKNFCSARLNPQAPFLPQKKIKPPQPPQRQLEQVSFGATETAATAASATSAASAAGTAMAKRLSCLRSCVAIERSFVGMFVGVVLDFCWEFCWDSCCFF